MLKFNRSNKFNSFIITIEDIKNLKGVTELLGMGLDNLKFQTGQYASNVVFIFKRGRITVPIFMQRDGAADKDLETEMTLVMTDTEFEQLPDDYYKIQVVITDFKNQEIIVGETDCFIEREEIKDKAPITRDEGTLPAPPVPPDEGGFTDFPNPDDVIIGGDTLPGEEVPGK